MDALNNTPNLQMPLLMPAQAQKHLTHNDALQRLDAIVQLAVGSRQVSAPPAGPSEGQRYLVAPAGAGAWAGHTDEIASWRDGAWEFYAPRPGWLALVVDENALVTWTGTRWALVASAGGTVPLLGINASADAVNRLAVRSDASLFDAAGHGHQMKINKAGAGDTASVLFQTGYAGCAEIGTTGDDSLHVKVSADGAAWHEALVVEPATGNVGIGTASPEASLHLVRDAGSATSFLIGRHDDAVAAPTWTYRKSRGSKAAPAAVAGGDVVMASFAAAHDGSGYVGCGNLRWVVDGPVAAGSVPTRAEFWTFSAGGHTEKMRITAGGNVGVGTTTPTTKLDVNGPIRLGSYVRSTLPSAASCGMGALVCVSDDTNGVTIAFSDGNRWKRLVDNT